MDVGQVVEAPRPLGDGVAPPAVVAGDVDEATREVIVSCSLVVIILAVVPWRYVWQEYVTAKGDRWRGAAA